LEKNYFFGLKETKKPSPWYTRTDKQTRPARRAKMNEQTLRALSLIAAELHLQNLMTVGTSNNQKFTDSFTSAETIKGLAASFGRYFAEGELSFETVKLTVGG
jgi:hypothetical protein